MKRKLCVILGLALASGMMFTGCANSGAGSSSGSSAASAGKSSSESGIAPDLQEEGGSTDGDSSDSAGNMHLQSASELEVRFGSEGEPFALRLYDNDTAAAGRFDATEEFVDAVENNPVLEGWGNKIISISDGE